MFKTEDILAQLEQGAKITDIAADLTEKLNAANAEFEKRKMEKADEDKKRAAAREAIDKLLAYVKVYCPTAMKMLGSLSDFSDEDCVQVLDAFETEAAKYEKLFSRVESLFIPDSKKDKKEDTFSKFFSKYGI